MTFVLAEVKKNINIEAYDPIINIKWPRKKMVVSNKDKILPTINEFKKKIKYL